MKILITGVAGFIGHTLAIRMLERGDEVVGIDNLNNYYDVRLKENRLTRLAAYPRFRFIKLDIADGEDTKALFAAENSIR